MSLESDLHQLYTLGPMYLFPIVAVLFSAFLVFVFGFKKSPSFPPTAFSQLDDERKTPVKKKKVKDVKGTSASKPQLNGHVVSRESKDSTLVKSNAEKKADSKKSPVKEKKEKQSIDQESRKGKKKAGDVSQVGANEVEDDGVASGEWVQIISNKEKKNRKLKEEKVIAKKEKESAGNEKENKPPKTKKKGKENKESIVSKGKQEDSKKSEDTAKKSEGTAKKSEGAVMKPVVTNNKVEASKVAQDEHASVDDHLYALAKEERAPKKLQKQRSGKQRVSESEVTKENSLEETKETNSKVATDKLTAEIVANYDSVDKNKPDSSNTANNKKKKETKPKKNQEQAQQKVDKVKNAVNAHEIVSQPKKKDVIDSSPKKETVVKKETIVKKEKEAEIVNTINEAAEVTKPLEDDFQLAKNKKRRARKE